MHVIFLEASRFAGTMRVITIYTNIHAHTHTLTHTHIHIFTHTRTYIYKHVQACNPFGGFQINGNNAGDYADDIPNDIPRADKFRLPW